MQQPTHPLPSMAAVPPAANITTEQIQKYLDENKQLILAILDNQNLGKLSECAQYQALLQKNLLYLAAIADAQPAATGRPLMMPQGTVPQSGHFVPQQQHMFHPRPPLQFSPQQMQEQQQQQLHHQAQGMPFPGQMVMRPGVPDGMHNVHVEPSLGGTADRHAAQSLGEFARSRSGMGGNNADTQGNKQDTPATEPFALDGRRSSGTERGGRDAD